MPVYLQGAANTLTDDDDREVLRRRYCGNFIYEDGILQRVLVEGGFITFSNGTPQYHFYIKDHLGSNRVVTDANGNIEEYNHYYPYGALMNISSASTQPYKYNGKELNRLNRLLWYDQSARQYNPILGRFMSMDPHCESYYSHSPYSYCKGNPICRIDPNGKDDYFTQDGKHKFHDNNNSNMIHIVNNKTGSKLKDKTISLSEIIPIVSFSLATAEACKTILNEGLNQKDGDRKEIGFVVTCQGEKIKESVSGRNFVKFELSESDVKNAEATIHLHPFAFNSKEGGGYSLATLECISSADIDLFKNFPMNFVVGWTAQNQIIDANVISSQKKYKGTSSGIAIWGRDATKKPTITMSQNSIEKIIKTMKNISK